MRVSKFYRFTPFHKTGRTKLTKSQRKFMGQVHKMPLENAEPKGYTIIMGLINKVTKHATRYQVQIT